MKLTKQYVNLDLEFIQFENATKNSSRTLLVGNAQYKYLRLQNIYNTTLYILILLL